MPFSSDPDEEVFKSVRDGNAKALQVLMQRYWEPVFHMAMKTLQDTLAAEDVVQEVFITIWEKRSRIDLKYSLKAYLFACARYEIYRQVKRSLDKKQQLKGHTADFIEYFNPLKQLEYEELLEKIEALVDQFPEKRRAIYRLSRNEQLSHQEISALLKVKPKTVENQITLALKHLRKGLLHVVMFVLTYLISR